MSKFAEDGLPFWKSIVDPKERRKEYNKWHAKITRRKFPDREREKQREYYRKKYKAEPREEWTREKELLRSARYNSRTKNREFNLDLDDIIIPQHCPILGIEIDRDAKRSYNSPSIDRIDSSKGYIKGNIQIVSWRANLIKNNMTLWECEKLLEHLRKINE